MVASAEACVILLHVKMVASVLHLVTVQYVHVHRSTLEQTVKVSDTYITQQKRYVDTGPYNGRK